MEGVGADTGALPAAAGAGDLGDPAAAGPGLAVEAFGDAAGETTSAVVGPSAELVGAEAGAGAAADSTTARRRRRRETMADRRAILFGGRRGL